MDAFFDGENSWKVVPQTDCWLYCDASSYFQAFVNACLRADHQIFIAGWDIHSDTLLLPQFKKSLRRRRWLLKNFLPYLLKRKPHLNIYVLSWDYAPVYLLERERFQSFKRGWLSTPGIHFHLDAAHPISASQHQKFVVVDDGTAFVGGLDITIRRWDDVHHRSLQRLRKDPFGRSYDPFHDYQMGFNGEAATYFGALFRERWNRATGLSIPPAKLIPQRAPDPAPRETVATFTNALVGISRTMPAFKEFPAIQEILHLLDGLIAEAQQFILIENQYLTSRAIVEALGKVLEKENGPEVVVILPEIAGGWLEVKTMGALQTLALQKLQAFDKHKRLMILYPFDSKRTLKKQHMTVHSKVMVIDDKYFTIGSANLNNRSMGFDSECQVTIDARADRRLRGAVLRTAAFMCSHHLQIRADEFLALYQQQESLIFALNKARNFSPKRFLKPFILPEPDPKARLEDFNWLDMEKPSPIEEAIDRWGHISETLGRKFGFPPRTTILILTVAIGLIIALVYKFTPIRELANQEYIRTILQNIDNNRPETMIYVPVVYAVGALLFIPINLLIIATASLFSWNWALFYILIGVVANVCAGYALGILSGKYVFRKFFGKRTRTILKRIGEGRFMTLVLLRILPVAPSALINLAAGAGQIPFFRFVAATVIGMSPGTFMLVMFQKSILDVFREQSVSSVLTVIVLGIVTAVLFFWARRRFSQYQQR